MVADNVVTFQICMYVYWVPDTNGRLLLNGETIYCQYILNIIEISVR